jgi:predicted ABC-type exoprotein transport system permease subunit
MHPLLKNLWTHYATFTVLLAFTFGAYATNYHDWKAPYPANTWGPVSTFMAVLTAGAGVGFVLRFWAWMASSK